jgi:hypothetical protein
MKIKIFILFLTAASINIMADSSKNIFQKEFNMYKLAPLNNFLFLAPPLIWNIAFTSKLPIDHFSQEAPTWILVTQGIFRISINVYPLLLPIDSKHKFFLPGLTVYSVGLLLYFSSWTILMTNPESNLANNPIMQFAPAYLPLIWLIGISIMSKSVIYPMLSTAFTGFHIAEYVFRYNILEVNF